MKTLRNAGDKEELLTRLSQIRPATARRWGKMTAHQMVCHLADGFRMYMGLYAVEPVPLTHPRLMTFVALWAPIRWPKGFQTARELDQQEGSGTPPAAFEEDMRALRELLDRFTRRPRDFNWPAAHPHFGPLTEKQWMRLAYLHMDHHLRQFGT